MDSTARPKALPASGPNVRMTSGADTVTTSNTVARPAVSSTASPHSPARSPGSTQQGAWRSNAGTSLHGPARPTPAAAPATTAQPTAASAGSTMIVDGVAASARTAPPTP